MLSIFSWNIRQGGGRRTAQIVEAIQLNQPTIVIFSEFRNNARGDHLSMLMQRSNYKYRYITEADKNVNSVAIFSKIAGNIEIHHDADPVYSNNIISVHYDAFSICGVYLPHKKKHQLIPYITQLGENKHYIIAGDYNTGKNYIDQKGKTFWYTDELLKFEQSGYTDAFRYINGEVLEYSWYSHQRNGFRYDHTYIHNDLIPITKKCYYLHKYREQGISDHSPMVLELG